MTLFILAFLGGILTILVSVHPPRSAVCIRERISHSGEAAFLLAGMAVTCGVFALAAVGGDGSFAPISTGWVAAMVLLAIFGLTLLWPGLADRLSRPVVQLGWSTISTSD